MVTLLSSFTVAVQAWGSTLPVSVSTMVSVRLQENDVGTLGVQAGVTQQAATAMHIGVPMFCLWAMSYGVWDPKYVCRGRALSRMDWDRS